MEVCEAQVEYKHSNKGSNIKKIDVLTKYTAETPHHHRYAGLRLAMSQVSMVNFFAPVWPRLRGSGLSRVGLRSKPC